MKLGCPPTRRKYKRSRAGPGQKTGRRPKSIEAIRSPSTREFRLNCTGSWWRSRTPATRPCQCAGDSGLFLQNSSTAIHGPSSEGCAGERKAGHAPRPPPRSHAQIRGISISGGCRSESLPQSSTATHEFQPGAVFRGPENPPRGRGIHREQAKGSACPTCLWAARKTQGRICSRRLSPRLPLL